MVTMIEHASYSVVWHDAGCMITHVETGKRVHIRGRRYTAQELEAMSFHDIPKLKGSLSTRWRG